MFRKTLTKILALGLSVCAMNVAQAQIGASREQLLSRWKGGTNYDATAESVRAGSDSYLPGGKIDFPHGNHGGGIVLEYSLDESGIVRFEQWWSDGSFDPAAVLKQSEPGYTWTERPPSNWFGTALGKQALHACYQHARINSRLYIAPLAAVPDKGQGGLEFWDYQDTLTSPLYPSKN
jgi:hypothetical protein